jgi:hypothetical protein
MCTCHAGHAPVTGAGGLRGHVAEGGARVVAEVNGVPVADVYVWFGRAHDNLCACTDMRTVPLHAAADIDPTTKGYSVIASVVVSAAEDSTAD